jgi:hypothetical protein
MQAMRYTPPCRSSLLTGNGDTPRRDAVGVCLRLACWLPSGGLRLPEMPNRQLVVFLYLYFSSLSFGSGRDSAGQRWPHAIGCPARNTTRGQRASAYEIPCKESNALEYMSKDPLRPLLLQVALGPTFGYTHRTTSMHEDIRHDNRN